MSILLLWESEDNSAITVDGEVDDWIGISQTEQEANNVNSANIDIIGTSAYTDSIYLSLLTTTNEPIFASSEVNTIRILIDSDNSADTGYSLPGVGADQMVEMYGKGQTVLSSVLYSFNDNRETNDWNGFFALSSVNSRTKGVNTETQVPLFDLGSSAADEMKIVWQTTNNNDMIDLADTVVSLKDGHFSIESTVEKMKNEANSNNYGEGIVVDGYFGDWNNIDKIADYINSAESEHITLQEYAAVEDNAKYFMYMNVKGKMLNGISIPSYTAKSMPDLKTGSYSNNEPVGTSNQETFELPVISGEDTIYVLVDTDNDYTTGYSSLGTGIGAEKMVEIKGVHGIITLRVVKDWTGTDVNDWAWSEGVAVDAAASGSELELEVPNGKYWIHIISWNGDQDSSTDFDLNNDEGRYVNSGSNCFFYYRMNSNSLADSCSSTAAGGSLSKIGGAVYDGSMGYIDGGVDMQGSDDYLTGSYSGIDITADWSFETWFNTDVSNDGAIFFIGDNDGTFTNQKELSIGLVTSDELELCYADSASNECDPSDRVRTSSVNFNTDQWYHIAVVHDDSGGDITIFVNGVAVKVNDATVHCN